MDMLSTLDWHDGVRAEAQAENSVEEGRLAVGGYGLYRSL